MNQSWWDMIIYWSVQQAYRLSCQLRSLHIHYSWYQRQTVRGPEAAKSKLYLQTMLKEYRYSISIWLDFVAFWRWVDRLRWRIRPEGDKQTTMERTLEHRLVWVQVVLQESELLLNELGQSLGLGRGEGEDGRRSYEFIGWIPRSITRTLDRFQRELTGHSRGLRIADYRLLKYQALASCQFFCVVSLFCWGSAKLWRWLWFQPILKALWTYSHDRLFVNTWQAHLARLDWIKASKLDWLNEISTVGTRRLHANPWEATDLVASVVTKAMAVAEEHAWVVLEHFWWGVCSLLIAYFGRRRLAIVNSWLQESFYSLNDTMKAFCLILGKDLCIGFHSPHGWEIVIGATIHALGFSPNTALLSLIVSTLPVIIDTILKYWIFRHLNRISPSIVVTYHAMNE